VEIYFGPVKSTIALVDFVFNCFMLKSVLEGVCGDIPNLIRTYVFYGLGGQLNVKIFKPEGSIYLKG